MNFKSIYQFLLISVVLLLVFEIHGQSDSTYLDYDQLTWLDINEAVKRNIETKVISGSRVEESILDVPFTIFVIVVPKSPARIVYVNVAVSVSPTSNTPTPSPATSLNTAAPNKSSTTVTPVKVAVPVFATVKVYITTSPTDTSPEASGSVIVLLLTILIVGVGTTIEFVSVTSAA